MQRRRRSERSAVATISLIARARGSPSMCRPASPIRTSTAKRGDLDLDPRCGRAPASRPTRPAAVLVPVVDHAEPTVLLTIARQTCRAMPGQIAFPGGKIDPTDASPLAAALREADEEIGLDRALVEPLGYLDLYLTFSGFRILPVVARVSPASSSRSTPPRSPTRSRCRSTS